MKVSFCKKQVDGTKYETVETDFLEIEAAIAVEMIVKWGMVAAMPDGEDSAGRQQMRLSTPDELVDRAFEVASLIMLRANSEGLVHDSIGDSVEEWAQA